MPKIRELLKNLVTDTKNVQSVSVNFVNHSLAKIKTQTRKHRFQSPGFARHLNKHGSASQKNVTVRTVSRAPNKPNERAFFNSNFFHREGGVTVMPSHPYSEEDGVDPYRFPHKKCLKCGIKLDSIVCPKCRTIGSARDFKNDSDD